MNAIRNLFREAGERTERQKELDEITAYNKVLETLRRSQEIITGQETTRADVLRELKYKRREYKRQRK